MVNTFYKVASVEGLDIFYIEAGSEKNPTIVLLHGFPSSSYMFRHLIDDLKDKYHLIAPTYPGFGLSSMPSMDQFEYSFVHYSKIIEKFLKQINVEKASFYMQDYGGPVGLNLFMRRPEMFQTFILQNANAYKEGLGKGFSALANLWTDPDGKAKENAIGLLSLEGTKFQYFDGAGDPQKIDPSIIYIDQYFLDRKDNQKIMLALFKDYENNVKSYPEWQKKLRENQRPALVVWGDKDTIFPAEGGRAYGKDVNDIEYNFYPTGHFALEEYHSEIAGKMDDFLKRKLK